MQQAFTEGTLMEGGGNRPLARKARMASAMVSTSARSAGVILTSRRRWLLAW